MGYSNTVAQKQTTETGNTFSGANAQRKMAAVPVLQKVENEEEMPIQGVFEVQKQAPEEELPIQKKSNNTGLPDNLKSGVENLSGISMDDVKVHYNSSKPAQLQALAYAQGTDIHVAPGQEQHLPHEAWHVVQQKQGRVQPTMQMKEGVAVNDDKGLESEADVMGGKVISLRLNNNETASKHTLALKSSPASISKVAQRVPIPIGKDYFDGNIPAFLTDKGEAEITIKEKATTVHKFELEKSGVTCFFDHGTGLYYNDKYEQVAPASLAVHIEQSHIDGLKSLNILIEAMNKAYNLTVPGVAKLPTANYEGKITKPLTLKVVIPDLLGLIQEANKKKLLKGDDPTVQVSTFIHLVIDTPDTDSNLLDLVSDKLAEISGCLANKVPRDSIKDLQKLAFYHNLENSKAGNHEAKEIALNDLAGDLVGEEMLKEQRELLVKEAFNVGINLSSFLKNARGKKDIGWENTSKNINAMIKLLLEEVKDARMSILEVSDVGIVPEMKIAGITQNHGEAIQKISELGIDNVKLHAILLEINNKKIKYTGDISDVEKIAEFIRGHEDKQANGEKLLKSLSEVNRGQKDAKEYTGIKPLMESVGLSKTNLDSVLQVATHAGFSLNTIEKCLKRVQKNEFYNKGENLGEEKAYLLNIIEKNNTPEVLELNKKNFSDDKNLYNSDVMDLLVLDSADRAKKKGHTLPENGYIERHFTPVVMKYLAANSSMEIEVYEGRTLQALSYLTAMDYTKIVPFGSNANTDFQQFITQNPDTGKASFVIVGFPGRAYQREIAAHFAYYNPPVNPLRITFHTLKVEDASAEDFKDTLSLIPNAKDIIVQMGNVSQVETTLNKKGIKRAGEIVAPNLYGLMYNINNKLMISLRVEPYLYADRSGAFLRAIQKKYTGNITVIFTGTAGALDQNLEVGDLVAPSKLQQTDELQPTDVSVPNKASDLMAEKYSDKEKEGMIHSATHGAVDTILFEDNAWFERYDKVLTIVEQEVAHLANAVAKAKERTELYALFRISDVLGKQSFNEEAIRGASRPKLTQGDLVVEMLEASLGKEELMDTSVKEKKVDNSKKEQIKGRKGKITLDLKEKIVEISTEVFNVLNTVDPKMVKFLESQFNEILASDAKIDNKILQITNLFLNNNLNEDLIEVKNPKTEVKCKFTLQEPIQNKKLPVSVQLLLKINEKMFPLKVLTKGDKDIWSFDPVDIKMGQVASVRIKIDDNEEFLQDFIKIKVGKPNFLNLEI